MRAEATFREVGVGWLEERMRTDDLQCVCALCRSLAAGGGDGGSQQRVSEGTQL